MNFKKILALVLVVAMCLSMVPTYAFADDVELWDEGDAAVQNDAPLEDEYIDEDPVTQEPAEEEPEATDPAEPAAEESAPAEPAAEESAPAEASADTSNALTAEELNAYAALGDKAMIGSKTYPTFAAAVDAAVAGDTITMLADDTLAAPVTLDKDLTIQSGTTVATLTGTILITGGHVTLTNVNTTSVTVTGGKLSIPENDLGTNTSIIASAGITGDVKGGKFDEISGSLLADGYAPVGYEGLEPLSGTVQAKNGLAKYTWVATRVDANGTYYYTNDKFANAFGKFGSDPYLAGDVTLLANVTLSGMVEVPSRVTLDLKGHTITNSTGFNGTELFHVKDLNPQLTIKDTDTAGTGAITATGTGVKHAIYHDFGTLTIQSGKISGPNAIYVDSGTLNISGGTLTSTADALSTQDHIGAAIYVINPNGDLTATITISNGTLSGPRAVFEEGSLNVVSITVTGGIFKTTDTTATKNTVVLKTVDTTADSKVNPSFSGGTYDTRVSDKYLKQGSVCVKNTEGTWTIQPGSYVAYILNKDKSVSVGYEQSNFTDAVAAAITGYKKTANDSLYLFVESGEQTATLEAGNSMRVQIKDTDVSFIPYLADPVNTYFVFLNEPGKPLADYTGKPIPKTENPIQIIVENYIAKVGTQYYENTDAKWSEAIADAKELKAVFEPLKTGGSVALAAGDVIMIKETDKITVTVNKDLGVPANYQIVKIAGEEYNTYKCIVPVASYVDAEGNTVYTETFAEAATEAAKLAQRGNFRVNLYQKPAFSDTVKDVYALSENSTLTVIATGTDIMVAELEAKDPIYKSEYYKLMVTNDGEVAVEADHTEANADFIYTAKTPVAKARLNTTEETYEYFADVNEAVKFVVEDHPNDHLYLIPLDNKTFTVAENQIDKYLGKTIRIDNSGEKKIKLADVQYPTENPKNFYTYTATDAEGYTNYVLNPAVVKIPAKPEMNIYYDVVPGTNTKFFASFAEAVEADSTAVVELIATPTDLTTGEPTTETYELGIPGGPSTLKVKLNEFGWLKVNPYGQAALVEKPDTTDAKVTVYSLAEPVASITTGTGATAETKYYDDFAEAVTDAHTASLETCKTITLLKTIEEPYELAAESCFKVIKGEYDVTVTTAAPKAVLAETDKNGVTSYSVVDAVASIDFGEEVGIKYYATFAEAAKLAYAAEGVEPTLTVTLLKDPTDKFEVAAAGSFLVDIGETGAVIVSNNLSFAEGTALIADTPTPVSGGTKTYNVTIVNAVASVVVNGETKLYATLMDAVDAGNYKPIGDEVPTTINMLASDETAMKLSSGYQINVKLNNFTVNVVPYNEGAFVITEKLDEATGVTNYQCTAAVASIDFGGEEGVKYYASFNDAAKLAFVPADAEGELVITLYQRPGTDDKFEVSAPGMFTVDIGSTGAVLVRDNLSFAEGTTLVATPALVEGTTYTVTIVGAVAYVDNNGVPTYFDSFQHAVDAGNYAPNDSEVVPATIYMLASDETAMKLTEGYQVNVKLNGFTVGVVPYNEGPYMILDETDETTEVTNYQCITAVASIGADDELVYYSDFATAATAAAETETITLYQSADYVLGAEGNVKKLIVNKNDSTLTVEPGVTGQAVKETTAKVDDVVVTTYELSAPVASITVAGNTKYYSTFAKAVADGQRDNSETNVPIIVLLDNITDKYALAQGKQINVQYGNYDVVVEPAAILGGNPNVLYVTEGTVTNIKCIGAVASIQFNSEPKPTYYATWEEAFEEAFVSADTAIENALTVNILAPAYFEDDIFEPTTLGYVLVNTKIDIVPNISVTGSVKILAEPVEGDLYKVNIIEAVASRGSNSGKVAYFATIEDAVKGGSNANFPIVLLADNLSTTLAKGATLYINKNDHEFTVTKVDPELNWKDGTDVQYSILENQTGDVTVYSTGAGVAFIDFTKPVPSGEHDVVDQHNYVFYNTFADAVKAAAGTETIVVNAENAGLPAGTSYTVQPDETLIVDMQFAAVSVVAPEGYELNDVVVGTVHTYTVTETVAFVKANGEEKPYTDLTKAVEDAVKAYTGDNTAFLTLNKAPAEDFTFTFGMRDKMMVKKNGFTLDPAKISAPDGYFVTRDEKVYQEGEDLVDVTYYEYSVVQGIASVVAVENGKEVTYVYDNLMDAILKVKDIENEKAYNDETKDPANPDTVINLWADNPVAFTFSAPGGTGVQSLMIADNGFKPNLLPAAGTADKEYFVEEIGTENLGVTQYKNSQIIASVDYSPVWAEPGSEDEKIVNYSSFAAAANDAMRDGKVVKINAVYADFADDDVFEMRIGSLQVDRNYMITSDQLAGFIADKRIVPVGENVALSYTWDDPTAPKVATFVVEGSEAMIVYPGEATPRFFKTFLEAMKVQNGNVNLPITPLTDIKYVYTEAEVGDLRTFFLAENVNYEVDVKLDGYETVADETVTGKFDFVAGVCYIVSDVPVGYDANYATIYRNDYYATITSAVDAAQNTKTIVLMENNLSYEIQDADEVVIAQIGDANHQDVNSFVVTTNIEGSGVSYTHTDAVSGVHKGVYTYTVVAKQSIVMNPGEGGSFSDGTTEPKTIAIDIPDATIAATVYADANLPVRTGYKAEYYDGNDGNKYAATADTDEGILAFPDAMPENGLVLTPNWVAQDVEVHFFDGENEITALATKVKYGELITEPTYTVTGWHVVGWYKDAAFKHSFIFAATPVTSDLIQDGKVNLYANMEKDEFTVHFTSLADNVPDDSVNDLTVKYGDTITGPAVTDWTRAGYKDGKVTAWMYTAPGAAEPTAWDWSTGVTSNLTLVAEWEPETVTIVWADGSEVIHTDTDKAVGSELTPPDVSKRTKDHARIDDDYTWKDQDGVYYNGKVPYHTVDPWIFQINWIDQIDVSFIYDDELLGTIQVDKNMPLSAYENLPKPEDETKAYAWTLKGEDYDITTPVTATMTLVGTLVEAEPVPDYSGYATVVSSLSLEENINMNAYVTIKEGTDPADYGVTVTFNGETTVEGTLADLATYKGGEYKLSDIAIVAAPQMNDPADVTITYKGVEATTATLTVRGYAEEKIEDERYEQELKDLLVALLDFGAYSQLQFNYDTDNLANAKYSSGMVTTTDVPEFTVKKAGNVTGITGYSPALTLVSDTTLNMYFAAPKKGDFQFKVEGETAKATYSKKEYKVSLPKIAVAELGDEHDFTVTSGNETMTVTLAPLAYAYQHQNDEGSLGNVCKAVYLYYLAAVEWFS